jgi:hypothetical protein
MTACNDTKELRQYQKAWKDALNEEILIVPTEEDWLNASRIQFFLAQERKQDAGRKSPKRARQSQTRTCNGLPNCDELLPRKNYSRDK